MLRRSQDRFKKFIPVVAEELREPCFARFGYSGVARDWALRVQPGEEGVELANSSKNRRVELLFPPIGQVFTPNVENTNVTTIGFREFGASGTRNSSVRDVAEESLMLTGDQNIIDIDYVVQWRIKNAADFLFNIRNPEATVKLASESAIREVVGQATLEDAWPAAGR